ncbi:DUF6276 family protein [Natronobiforma cellulositropha]|uniref:DUF6276 family protein n=1 Tax=Natronobiforma cellulositropha TaxID=1679076 RepID=UPI0021D5991B|nr:DUF6276 family protein [Natronobiforma cellulositropha]
MTCPHCSSDTEPVTFAVPDTYRELAPGDAAAARLCPRCLRVDPASDETALEGESEFSRVSSAFPDGEGTVPFALLLELCSSLALNRAEIERALEALERAGVDPLLTIDRLLAEPVIDPDIDLERRRHQLEQSVY